ncbi:hypothetical protein IW261DRAFT_1431387 [Armillaria novae-zelandiae]|uniref:Uncharacterized protein n=1 Tax=Armillaria novae-zelandiae TaxID=153914 RepID=A0AA39PTL3_9AGAR|nr:hypothetical protein IW261DRAFT_1431387 [Armillaria novae-zelandiae]
MPCSRPTRTTKKAPRSHKKRGSGRGTVPPVMPAPEVEHIPDGEYYPGGGLMIRYKDTESIVYNEIFYPDDHEAFTRKCLSVMMQDLTDLCGDSAASYFSYESLTERAKSCPVAFKPPNPRDHHLYRTYEFSPNLWIRVWDSNIPILPGDHLEFFGVDMVDVSGRPQAVTTRVKVTAGARPPLAPEQEGDIIAALDDIGVRMDRFDSVPSRYPISAGLDYIFEDGRHTVTYAFHRNLFDEPAPERHTRWTRTKTGMGRSRSAD